VPTKSVYLDIRLALVVTAIAKGPIRRATVSMKVIRSTALAALAATFMAASAAQAGSQSSNTSSNSSSNNGVVRERVDNSYCANGYCERYIDRRIYRDNRRARWPRDYERRPYRY
jgi:hypothetical protein